MTIAQPPPLLDARGLLLAFDEDHNQVVSAANRSKVSPLQLQLARREVEAWLTGWAIWRDRDHEIAIEASERWRSTPAVRAALGMAQSRQEWQPPWIPVASMPRPPGGLLTWLAPRLRPRAWLRSQQRRRHAGFQRRHSSWLDTQVERWTALRADMSAAYGADQRFADAQQAMRAALQRGTDLADIENIAAAVLAALSSRLHLRHLQLIDQEVIRLQLGFAGFDTVSDIRHRPSPRCDSLVVDQSAEHQRQRVVELGCLACLTMADFFGTLRTSRKALLVTLVDQTSGEVILESSFAMGTLLGSAATILSELGARRVPRTDGWTVYWAKDSDLASGGE